MTDGNGVTRREIEEWKHNVRDHELRLRSLEVTRAKQIGALLALSALGGFAGTCLANLLTGIIAKAAP